MIASSQDELAGNFAAIEAFNQETYDRMVVLYGKSDLSEHQATVSQMLGCTFHFLSILRKVFEERTLSGRYEQGSYEDEFLRYLSSALPELRFGTKIAWKEGYKGDQEFFDETMKEDLTLMLQSIGADFVEANRGICPKFWQGLMRERALKALVPVITAKLFEFAQNFLPVIVRKFRNIKAEEWTKNPEIIKKLSYGDLIHWRKYSREMLSTLTPDNHRFFKTPFAFMDRFALRHDQKIYPHWLCVRGLAYHPLSSELPLELPLELIQFIQKLFLECLLYENI